MAETQSGAYDKSLTGVVNISCIPKQFRPKDTVTFRVQYSAEFSTCSLVFTVEGWGTGDAEHPNYTETRYVSTSTAGVHYEDFIVPAGTFYQPERDTDPVFMANGKCKAIVKFYPEIDREPDLKHYLGGGEALVDILIMYDTDYNFADLSTGNKVVSYSTNTSSATIRVDYVPRHDFGYDGDNDVQSYRLYLYSENNTLLKDTGELYEWSSNLYHGGTYTFTKLKDKTTYYVSANITLNGGYKLRLDAVPLTVDYSDTPVFSDKLSVSSTQNGVKLTLDVSDIVCDKVIFSRSLYSTSEYMVVANTPAFGSNVISYDYYAIPYQTYIYKAVVYSGGIIAATYYNTVTYTNSSVKISDIFGSYYAVGNITKHPISRNDRGAILEAMDSEFPYNIINGSPNYDSGTVDGLFAEMNEDCSIETDNGEYAEILRAWLNNGRAKLLTYYTGESWIVAVSGIQTTDPENNDVYNTTFNWTQIGDASLLSEYVRLGLVISDE